MARNLTLPIIVHNEIKPRTHRFQLSTIIYSGEV